jgi:LPXTG-site transpeptidase (sortase) family protein
VSTAGRIGKQVAAVTAAVQAIVMVLGIGMVIGSFVIAKVPAEAQYAAASPGNPIRLRMPSLKVTAPILPIQLSSDGVLDPPRDAQEVGWWDGSAQPGAAQGQTVITGHTVHTGGASMNRLVRLQPGHKVDVINDKGTMRYEVEQVSTLSREEVATQARVLFGQDHGGGQLVLVTCTDWNGSSYESNIVAVARPLGMVLKSDRRKKTA